MASKQESKQNVASSEEFRLPASKSLETSRHQSAVAKNDASRDAWKWQCSPTSAFASAAVVFIAMVILGTVYLGTWRHRQGRAIDEHELPFCCPREAQQTLRYVNTSVDPCNDFFAYVCSNVIKFRTWPDTSTDRELQRIVVTGAMPPGVKRSPAGDFLIAYFRSCVKKVASFDDFVSDIAENLVRKERSLLNRMDRKKAFVYATTAAAKYQTFTAFYVSYETLSARLIIAYSARCTVDEDVSYIIAASVAALNVVLNVSTSIERALEFTATICGQTYSTETQITNYTAANLSNFYNQVWRIEDVEAGLDSIGYSLSNAQYIEAYGAERLGRMHHILSTVENSAIEEGVLAAYFLWHSVLSITGEFYGSDDSTPQFVLKACNDSLENLWQISYSFTVDVLTSTEKDAHAHAIFADVRDAVRAECMASGLFQEEDMKPLDNFFQDLTLYTPAEVRSLTAMIPKPSRDFFENLLRGREYNFQAEKVRLAFVRKESMRHYRNIDFIGESRVYLTPEMYTFIRAGTENADLLNMAAFGRTLAEALWVMLFYGIPWTSGTVTNLLRLKECYDRFYGIKAEDNSREDITLITALGLSSVLKAFKRPGWYSVKPAWSLLRLSHGQLFYILATYARCPKRSSRKDVCYINGPLMYVKDFAEAFFCPSDAPMARHQQCFLDAQQN
ncbi:hypothetical protein HPB49_019803 [Dermacentor silvarum]|uniref:Uncharacterized protein n=1 Tax=Dermacentor silvarum TaxID=543639 RepID=A0ACB8C553_DERSI|nr:hypothetical protein HPB49_019803 [Dermacentor silvarum]